MKSGDLPISFEQGQIVMLKTRSRVASEPKCNQYSAFWGWGISEWQNLS